MEGAPRSRAAFVNFAGISQPGARKRKGGPGGAQSSPDLRSLFATCHHTRSPHPRHQPATAGRKDHQQQPGLANSGFRTRSATRVPSEPPRCAPLGSKQIQFHSRRGCLLQMQESSRIRRNFSRSWAGHRGRCGFAGRGCLWTGETPPTSFSSFLRPTPGARPFWPPEGWAAPKS